MMKKITFLMAFILILSAGYAQNSFVLSWGDITYGDTAVVQGSPADEELIFHAILTNNSDETVKFGLIRRLVYLLDGTTTSYCWGNSCFPPNNTDSIVVARDSVILGPGESTDAERFSGHYTAEDNGALDVIGTSMVEYTFFNKDNENEKVTVLVRYETSELDSQFFLSWEGVTYGDTAVVQGDPDTNMLVFHAILTNNTDQPVTFKLKRRIISLLEGTTVSYCWGNSCWPPNNTDTVIISRDSIILAAGESTTAERFSGDYVAEDYGSLNVIGTSYVEFTMFNTNNEDQKVSVVVEYVTTPNGINDHLMDNGYVSEIYPNPATSYVNLNYELPAKVQSARIKIINLLGSVVKTVKMDKGTSKLKINISDLPNGVYFYSIVINNEIYKTKKLIIK